MACSKIFSDLPELINEIIQYFQNDYKTLHSFILINRLWCRLAIPLLWEDPFSIPTKNNNFVEIYLRNLSDSDKKFFNKHGINSDLFPSNTLFNYSRFIKCLNIHKINLCVKEWFTHKSLITSKHFNMDIVFKLLFKTFVENENSVNLHTFEFEIHKYSHFSTTYELILQNPNFLRNIRNFKFYYSPFQHEKTIYLFLNFIFSNCNLISSIQFSYNSSNALINEYVLKLINSQHNLKKFVLRDYNKSNYPLLPLKIPNYSNTLKTIIFYCVDFKYVVDVNGKIFERLNVLESVHILHCYSLEYLIQQIINIEKPFQLKSLFMNGIADIKSLELLLRKSGDYLENFVFGSFKNDEQKNQIFELLIKYCTKIKFIDLIGVIICQNIFLVFGLIENIKQNLNHLSIDILDYSHQFIDDVMLSSTVLLNLGQILPCRLEYLNLSLKINTFHLLVFLKNSQNTFIRKLLIRDAKQEKSEEILPYIKEYIMKKKRVRYLAILGNLFGKEENLVSSKDEVKEFELYDIEIQHYDDLFIQIHDYMNLLMQY